MARIAVGLEYDGSSFAGWQRQVDAPSVQEVLQAALAAVCNHPVEVTGAGRTDAGVHARDQVAHFESDAARAERALLLGTNSNLPPAVALRWVRFVPDHFHARYSAQARSYRYCILNRGARSALACGRTAFVYQPLQVEPMIEAARMLIDCTISAPSGPPNARRGRQCATSGNSRCSGWVTSCCWKLPPTRSCTTWCAISRAC